MLLSPNVEEAELHGLTAAHAGIAEKVRVKVHQYMLAFALTDFKLQGRTLPKLILSVGKRSRPPWMTISAFYVLVSRVRTAASLRVLHRDADGLASIGGLEPNEFLAAWERGYDAGAWSDARAKAALEDVRLGRKHLKEVAAAAKAEARARAGQARAQERKEAAAAQPRRATEERAQQRAREHEDRAQQHAERATRAQSKADAGARRAAPPQVQVAPALRRSPSRLALGELSASGANVRRDCRAQKRARDKSPPPAGVQPLPPTLVVQLQPSVGDFVKEVHTALRRQQGSKGSRTLWVYNDNEQDRHSAIAGEWNAEIRPYNRFGVHRDEPLAAGVTIGTDGCGYTALTPAVQAIIDEDLALISRLLHTGDYSAVRYPAVSRHANAGLGTGTFTVHNSVKKYIVEGLRHCVQNA